MSGKLTFSASLLESLKYFTGALQPELKIGSNNDALPLSMREKVIIFSAAIGRIPKKDVAHFLDEIREANTRREFLATLDKALGKRRSISQSSQAAVYLPIPSEEKESSRPTPMHARSNFERAQEIIKEFEGGFADKPGDPSGVMNFGITAAVLATWRKQPVTNADLRNLTYQEAKDIYFTEYWLHCSCNLMPGPLALPVYNIAVHAGPATAGRFLQRALNNNGSSLEVNGKVDADTLDAVAKTPLADLINDIIDLYEAKLRSHAHFDQFKKGFLRRVGKLRTETQKWLIETRPEEPTLTTPKLAEERDAAIDELLRLLNSILAKSSDSPQPDTPIELDTQHQPGVAAPGSAAPQDNASAIAVLLRQLLDTKTGSPALPPGTPQDSDQIENLPEDDADEGRRVELLYATTRERDRSELVFFTGERSETISFGTAKIRIPELHRLGRVELPFKLQLFSIKLYEKPLEPSKHFIVEVIESVTLDEWKSLVASSGLKEALVFVHGFNVTFQDAIYRLAQITWDLKYRGLPVLFSWPSRGQIMDYAYDRESALGARDSFLSVLRNLQSSGIERIHILAHSMGNFLVLEALNGCGPNLKELAIGEMMMAAPDLDSSHYLSIARKLSGAFGMTMYASAADRALAVAKRIAGNVPRAGDVPLEGPLIVQGVDSIDVTAIGVEMLGLGHSVFATKRSILNDVGLLLQGLRPPHNRLSEIRGVPGRSAPKWWRYVR